MHQEVKTRAEFDAAIRQGKVLVDFWATWCGPCQMMGQSLQQELEPNHPEISIVKVNVDEAPELAASFGIMSIPTLLAYQDGVKIGEFVGVTPVAQIISAFS